MSVDLAALRAQCDHINSASWTGVSSYWAARTILDLISQIDTLTTERDSFALYIARTTTAHSAL